MSLIHEKKDQLILSLATFQATIWVGLFSVGFWEPEDVHCWQFVFWFSFIIMTFSMIGTFISSIACFYYFKYNENSTLSDVTDEFRKKHESLAEKWRVPWNWYWKTFIIGILSSTVAVFARFSGA